mmetsp:Transcript_53093/g.170072  ORF Transcript_53093/g.170072 Transcript_53093/m.170072 type:complete len:352 (-) Transcript_53093:1651-2706(-)
MAERRAATMHVHEEPPDAGVHADIVDAQPEASPWSARGLVHQPLVADRSGRAHVSDVGHVLRADVALPLVHPERIHQVPAFAVPRVLGVVLGHKVELCLLPLVVSTKVCLTLGANFQRTDCWAAAVFLPQRMKQVPRDRNKWLCGHLCGVRTQELMRAKIFEIVQWPWLAHGSQAHVPVLRDKHNVKLRGRTSVEASQGWAMVTHLLGHRLRGRLGLHRVPSSLNAWPRAGPGRRCRVAHEVLPDLRLRAPHVVLERLAVQLVAPGWHALVEKHVRLCTLDLLRADHAHLQIVELIPLLWLLLVLTVRNVVAAAHGANVLDQPYQLVLHGLRWGLLEKARQVKGPVHWEGH